MNNANLKLKSQNYLKKAAVFLLVLAMALVCISGVVSPRSLTAAAESEDTGNILKVKIGYWAASSIDWSTVNFTNGTTYEFSFYHSDADTGAINSNTKFSLKHAHTWEPDNPYAGITVQRTDDTDYNKVTLSFTPDGSDWQNLRFVIADSRTGSGSYWADDLRFYDFRLTEAGSDVNLLTDGLLNDESSTAHVFVAGINISYSLVSNPNGIEAFRKPGNFGDYSITIDGGNWKEFAYYMEMPGILPSTDYELSFYYTFERDINAVLPTGANYKFIFKSKSGDTTTENKVTGTAEYDEYYRKVTFKFTTPAFEGDVIQINGFCNVYFKIETVATSFSSMRIYDMQIKQGDNLYLFNMVSDQNSGVTEEGRHYLIDKLDFTTTFNEQTDGIAYFEKYETGDVNGDTKIDILDLVVLKKYLSSTNPVRFVDYAADTNKDTIIGATDLTNLRKYLLGVDTWLQ